MSQIFYIKVSNFLKIFIDLVSLSNIESSIPMSYLSSNRKQQEIAWGKNEANKKCSPDFLNTFYKKMVKLLLNYKMFALKHLRENGIFFILIRSYPSSSF